MARALEASARPTDVVARFGGEEFIVLLPKTGGDDACKVAERIRSTVARGQVCRVDDEAPMKGVTVSAGVTQHRIDDTAATFVDRAHKALYAAKFAGRNRVHQR